MIAIASDHAGLGLKNQLKAFLEKAGYNVKDFGTHSTESCDYPEYALTAARSVVSGECERGILVCGTGVGISIAANKVAGVRCVCCSEPFSAVASRNHNDTNMLALGARVVGDELALMITRLWLEAEFEGGRHSSRLEQIAKIEKA